ncbi:hypothetical protein LCGC14_0366030, partial [marine sediment metagenome]
MPFESVIVPNKADVVKTAKSDAMEIVYTDKGKEYTKKIFDKKLWPLFAVNTPVKITMDKQGEFWNIVSAVSAKDEP